MNNENNFQLSRPNTSIRRLNLDVCSKTIRPHIHSKSEMAAMSPMTDLAHNLSGASLDSTPKRRILSQGNIENEECIMGIGGSVEDANTCSSNRIFSSKSLLSNEKENAFSITQLLKSPDKRKPVDDVTSIRSPKPNRIALADLDCNSPIKAGFVKPAPRLQSEISTVRLPSIEDVDSQDSGCYPEDIKQFKYPDTLVYRRLSDRNSVSSPAPCRSSSSLTTPEFQKSDDPAAKLNFSFMSSGDDEGIPDDIYEEDDSAVSIIPSSLNRLFDTPLSEKASEQFSNSDDSFGGLNMQVKIPVIVDHVKGSENSEKSRPHLRRSFSMYENVTPNSRSQGITCKFNSPMNVSPVARGLFGNDDDPGASPLAPLGLYTTRFRPKPSRVIQPVGGPPFKRSEPPTEETGVLMQGNKRRKDDNEDQPLSGLSDSNIELNKLTAIRPTHRIQRCHSETEATIMRALQRSSEEPDLIGDFTRPFVLPLTPGKHQDLKSITPQTLVDLLEGKFQDKIEKFTIVDCRYPFEYEYGHICHAVNLWTKDMVWDSFMEGKKPLPATTNPSPSGDSSSKDQKRNIIIFHCEFSSERGPKLSRYLRNKDRDGNKDNYPALHWPEIYLLEGGYKAFHEKFQNWCEPNGYRPMLHQGYEEDLRKCRAKTKSSSGEGKQGRPLTRSTSRRLDLN